MQEVSLTPPATIEHLKFRWANGYRRCNPPSDGLTMLIMYNLRFCDLLMKHSVNENLYKHSLRVVKKKSTAKFKICSSSRGILHTCNLLRRTCMHFKTCICRHPMGNKEGRDYVLRRLVILCLVWGTLHWGFPLARVFYFLDFLQSL